MKNVFKRSAFVGGLTVALTACSGPNDESATRTLERSSSPSPRAKSAPVPAQLGAAVPGQMIVKFKASGPHAVTDCLQKGLKTGAKLSSLTADGSGSLDSLMRKHGIRGAHALIRGRVGLKTNQAKKKLLQSFPRSKNAVGPGRNHPSDLVNVYRLELSAGTNLSTAIAEMQNDPHVEYAQPNYQVEAVYEPNDPFLSSSGSWGQSESDLWGLDTLDARQAWELERGAGVVVAVVDTGLDVTHPDISGNVWENSGEVPENGVDDDGNGYVDDVLGWNFNQGDMDVADGNGHGTHVSGTIAAQDDNGIGIVGVAPDARIMAVKGLSDTGSGTIFDLAEAVVYASENGADVINNSWGCSGACPSSPVIEDAVTLARDMGSVVVFAAGNANSDTWDQSPQNHPATIVVSASDPDDERAGFSNYGFVDVAAPGAGRLNNPGVDQPERGILSLRPTDNCVLCSPALSVGGDYLRLSGTSMAAPHVSGIAALIRSQHPEYTPEQVRQILRRGAIDGQAPGYDPEFGFGVANALQSLGEGTPLVARIETPRVIHAPTTVDIAAFVGGANFASYTLEYGEGANASAFFPIAQGINPSMGDPIATWDISSLADGDYTLRLIATDSSGEQYEDRRRITLDHVILTSPEVLSYHGDTTIEIEGTANPADFTSYDIAVESLTTGQELQDVDIALSGGGLSPIDEGLLGTWTTQDVPADHYRIVLKVHRQGGSTAEESVQVVVDPLIKPGFPVALPTSTLGFFQSQNSTLYDVTGDGNLEHVVVSAAYVSVIRADGSMAPGFPQSLGPAGSAAMAAPAVGDITGDGSPEVIATSLDGNLQAFDSGGQALSAFPLNFGTGPLDLALADLDADGVQEILATDGAGFLRAIRSDGSSLPGFPVSAPGPFGGAVTVADVDQDGDQEIFGFVGTGGPASLVAYDHTGQLLSGFPIQFASVSSGAFFTDDYPTIGDLNDDGDLEVVVYAASSSNPSAATVSAYHHDGQVVAGFPVALTSGSSSPPTMGDVDGDGSLEILFGGSDQGDSLLFAMDGSGVMLSGFPVHGPEEVTASSPYSSPAIFDFDGDGRREILASRAPRFFDPNFGPRGHVLQGYDYQGVPVAALARPSYDILFGYDRTPAIADIDGDGSLDMVTIEDQGFIRGFGWAHAYDLGVPADREVAWSGFRNGPNQPGVAEAVTVVETLDEGDRDVPMTVDGLSRYRITTGGAGVIQISHPWEADVQIAFDSGAFTSTPHSWGGPIQLSPNTTYLVRVKTPSPMSLRLSWW